FLRNRPHRRSVFHQREPRRPYAPYAVNFAAGDAVMGRSGSGDLDGGDVDIDVASAVSQAFRHGERPVTREVPADISRILWPNPVCKGETDARFHIPRPLGGPAIF